MTVSDISFVTDGNTSVNCCSTVILTVHFHHYVIKHEHESIQMNVFYNVRSSALSQDVRRASDEDAFSLHVDVAEDKEHNHMQLSICMRSVLQHRFIYMQIYTSNARP